MLLPRRKFLRSSLLFGTSALLVFGNARLGLSRTATDDLPNDLLQDPMYRFSKETFEPYIGGYFEAPNARGQMVALKLLKVDSYAPNSQTKISARPGAETESFSLLFSASEPLPLYKSIHPIKHGALGDFSLFLKRQNGKDEIYYEAVFNHVR
jgi:hypothetical protein